MKHSPGPWKWGRLEPELDPDPIEQDHLVDAEDWPVGVEKTDYASQKQHKEGRPYASNFALIASAPELLEMLLSLEHVQWWGDDDHGKPPTEHRTCPDCRSGWPHHSMNCRIATLLSRFR